MFLMAHIHFTYASGPANFSIMPFFLTKVAVCLFCWAVKFAVRWSFSTPLTWNRLFWCCQFLCYSSRSLTLHHASSSIVRSLLCMYNVNICCSVTFWNWLSALLAVFLPAHFDVCVWQPSLKWARDPSEVVLTVFYLWVQPLICPESFHCITVHIHNALLGNVMLWWNYLQTLLLLAVSC